MFSFVFMIKTFLNPNAHFFPNNLIESVKLITVNKFALAALATDKNIAEKMVKWQRLKVGGLV